MSRIFLVSSLILATVFNSAYAASENIAQTLFDEAMDKRASGKIFDAIELFETILDSQPALNRARLELAVTYHRATRYQDAMREFNTVLADPETPETVRLAILAYLGQLKSDEQAPEASHAFSYYIQTGLAYNSNINFQPGKSIITGGGFTKTTQNEISSTGVDLSLTASHRYRKKSPLDIDGAATTYEWVSQASVAGTPYVETSDYNFSYLSFNTGPAFISPGRWRAMITLRVDDLYLGGSNLATFSSLNPTITFDFGHYRSMTIETSLISHSYANSIDAGRDGKETIIGAGYNTLINNLETGLEAGIRLSSNDADISEFGYDSTELYAGSFHNLDAQSSIYMNISIKNFEYKGADIVSSIIRDETETGLALGHNIDLIKGLLKNWNMNTEFAYKDNDSNDNSFDYTQMIFKINWSLYIQ